MPPIAYLIKNNYYLHESLQATRVRKPLEAKKTYKNHCFLFFALKMWYGTESDCKLKSLDKFLAQQQDLKRVKKWLVSLGNSQRSFACYIESGVLIPVCWDFGLKKVQSQRKPVKRV